MGAPYKKGSSLPIQDAAKAKEVYGAITPLLNEALRNAKEFGPIEHIDRNIRRVIEVLLADMFRVQVRWPRALGRPDVVAAHQALRFYIQLEKIVLDGHLGGPGFERTLWEPFLPELKPRSIMTAGDDYVVSYRAPIAATQETGDGRRLGYRAGLAVVENVQWLNPEGRILPSLPSSSPEFRYFFKEDGFADVPPFTLVQ